MEPQSTQEKLMKCFLEEETTPMLWQAWIPTSPLHPVRLSSCTYERQSGTPLSIRHTGGSTDLLRYRIRGV